MNSGEGLIGNIPPLAGASWLSDNREQIACVIRYGLRGPVKVNGLNYDAAMPANSSLSDTEITNVANYILTAWENQYTPLSPVEVSENLRSCENWEKVNLQPEPALR